MRRDYPRFEPDIPPGIETVDITTISDVNIVRLCINTGTIYEGPAMNKPSSYLDSTGAAAVDHSYKWRPIEDAPQGVKLQLINRASGVACYGMHKPGDGFTHYAPLPTFDD